MTENHRAISKEIKLDGEVGKLLEAARRERRALEKELNEVCT